MVVLLLSKNALTTMNVKECEECEFLCITRIIHVGWDSECKRCARTRNFGIIGIHKGHHRL